jgi:hypothetical protein
MGFVPRAHQPDCPSIIPQIECHKDQLKQARKEAQEAINCAQELLKKLTKHQPYQKGHYIWLKGKNLQTTHPTAKLHPKHYGPFKITEVLGPMTSWLVLPPQWKIHNAFHATWLLPYWETVEHRQNFIEPPPNLVKGQPEWEVWEILSSRCYQGTLQYLVAWKGYLDAHNSWEPKKNLRAPQLIQEFHDHNPKAVQRLKVEATKTKDTKTTPREKQCQGQQLRVSAVLTLYKGH